MDITRQGKLDAVANTLQELTTSPLYEYRVQNNYKVVPGEGNAYARTMLIGEAPGEWEAKSGRPFVGASGRLLDSLLQSVGLTRSDVYITNVVKDRPPENRSPSAAEVRLYAPFLRQQIDIIQPRIIATLGRFAMEFLFDFFEMPEKGQKISSLHGSRLEAQASYGTVTVVPLYHPAVALYTTTQRETLAADFQVLRQAMEETTQS
jgi:uracil-DNA glycosylase